MPTTTRIPAAQDSLKAVLDARNGAFLNADGTRVAIDLGFPVPQVKAEHVYVDGDVTGWTQEEDTTDPNGVKIERFTLHVVSFAYKDSFLGARDRAFAFVAEIEAALRANPTLSAVVAYAVPRGGRAEDSSAADGWEYQIVLDVFCEADLTI